MVSNHDGLYKTDTIAIRARIILPTTSWAVSQAARLALQECEVDFTIVHSKNRLIVESWYEPDSPAEERFQRARSVLIAACFFITNDDMAYLNPLSTARSVVDRLLARSFEKQEVF